MVDTLAPPTGTEATAVSAAHSRPLFVSLETIDSPTDMADEMVEEDSVVPQVTEAETLTKEDKHKHKNRFASDCQNKKKKSVKKNSDEENQKQPQESHKVSVHDKTTTPGRKPARRHRKNRNDMGRETFTASTQEAADMLFSFSFPPTFPTSKSQAVPSSTASKTLAEFPGTATTAATTTKPTKSVSAHTAATIASSGISSVASFPSFSSASSSLSSSSTLRRITQEQQQQQQQQALQSQQLPPQERRKVQPGLLKLSQIQPMHHHHPTKQRYALLEAFRRNARPCYHLNDSRSTALHRHPYQPSPTESDGDMSSIHHPAPKHGLSQSKNNDNVVLTGPSSSNNNKNKNHNNTETNACHSSEKNDSQWFRLLHQYILESGGGCCDSGHPENHCHRPLDQSDFTTCNRILPDLSSFPTCTTAPTPRQKSAPTPYIATASEGTDSSLVPFEGPFKEDFDENNSVIENGNSTVSEHGSPETLDADNTPYAVSDAAEAWSLKKPSMIAPQHSFAAATTATRATTASISHRISHQSLVSSSSSDDDDSSSAGEDDDSSNDSSDRLPPPFVSFPVPATTSTATSKNTEIGKEGQMNEATTEEQDGEVSPQITLTPDFNPFVLQGNQDYVYGHGRNQAKKNKMRIPSIKDDYNNMSSLLLPSPASVTVSSSTSSLEKHHDPKEWQPTDDDDTDNRAGDQHVHDYKNENQHAILDASGTGEGQKANNDYCSHHEDGKSTALGEIDSLFQNSSSSSSSSSDSNQDFETPSIHHPSLLLERHCDNYEDDDKSIQCKEGGQDEQDSETNVDLNCVNGDFNDHDDDDSFQGMVNIVEEYIEHLKTMTGEGSIDNDDDDDDNNDNNDDGDDKDNGYEVDHGHVIEDPSGDEDEAEDPRDSRALGLSLLSVVTVPSSSTTKSTHTNYNEIMMISNDMDGESNDNVETLVMSPSSPKQKEQEESDVDDDKEQQTDSEADGISDIDCAFATNPVAENDNEIATTNDITNHMRHWDIVQTEMNYETEKRFKNRDDNKQHVATTKASTATNSTCTSTSPSSTLQSEHHCRGNDEDDSLTASWESNFEADDPMIANFDNKGITDVNRKKNNDDSMLGQIQNYSNSTFQHETSQDQQKKHSKPKTKASMNHNKCTNGSIRSSRSTNTNNSVNDTMNQTSPSNRVRGNRPAYWRSSHSSNIKINCTEINMNSKIKLDTRDMVESDNTNDTDTNLTHDGETRASTHFDDRRHVNRNCDPSDFGTNNRNMKESLQYYKPRKTEDVDSKRVSNKQFAKQTNRLFTQMAVLLLFVPTLILLHNYIRYTGNIESWYEYVSPRVVELYSKSNVVAFSIFREYCNGTISMSHGGHASLDLYLDRWNVMNGIESDFLTWHDHLRYNADFPNARWSAIQSIGKFSHNWQYLALWNPIQQIKGLFRVWQKCVSNGVKMSSNERITTHDIKSNINDFRDCLVEELTVTQENEIMRFSEEVRDDVSHLTHLSVLHNHGENKPEKCEV